MGKIYLLLVFLILTVYTNAQNKKQRKKGYSKGYIITLKNDTIHGFIKSKTKALSCQSVVFIDSRNNKKRKYYPRRIKAYYRNRRTFCSFKLSNSLFEDSRSAFLHRLKKGKISLYVLYELGTDHSMPSGALVVNYYSKIVTTEIFYLYNNVTEKLAKVRKIDFRKQLAKYFQQDRSLARMIANKEFRYDELPEIVGMYNENNSSEK